jgi:hypothetical protein
VQPGWVLWNWPAGKQAENRTENTENKDDKIKMI